MVNYKIDLMLYVIEAVIGFIFSPVICYLCIILYYIYGVIVFIFTGDFPSSGSFWEPPFTIMQAWYFYLFVLAIIMVGSWIKEYSNEKTYISQYTKNEIENIIEPEKKFDGLNYRNIYDIMTPDQRDDFYKFLDTTKWKLQQRVNANKISIDEANSLLRTCICGWMKKRGFNKLDIEDVLNSLNL